MVLFKSDNSFNRRAFLFLLPTFLVCFSNYFVLISGFSLNNQIDSSRISLLVLLNVFIVVNEEAIFRYFAMDLYREKGTLFRLFIPSLIFALAHLSRFFSTFNAFDLISVAYAFGLGLLLNVMYIFTHSFIPGLALHFLFNLCNDIILTTFFAYQSALAFVLINIGVVLVVILYLLFN